MPWVPWSPCGATCGLAEQVRTRECANGRCVQAERRGCQVIRCPGEGSPQGAGGGGNQFKEWEEWSRCSKTCGQGIQERKRECANGRCVQTAKRSCRIRSCSGTGGGGGGGSTEPEYEAWQGWSRCSKTCGQGIQERKRACVNGGCVQTAKKSCRLRACAGDGPDRDFLPWRAWSACTVTCGVGEKKRTRNCRPPANCVQTQTQSCSTKSCGGTATRPSADRFRNWEAWSPCSVPCGTGKETRRRRCKVGNCVEVAERSCRLESCFENPVTEYGSWTQWSECSATCGAGEVKRTRSFPDGSNVQEQLKYCNNKRCDRQDPNRYRTWQDWSGCSVTCDTGIRTRVRFCKVGSCRETKTASCKKKDCVPLDLDAKYGSWQSWGECSKTCGFGFTNRKRYCKIGICEQTASKTCRLKACPTDYTEWEEWGRCSVTCGSGISTRRRYCTVGSCEEKQQTACDMEKCGDGWEDWAEWQGCHKTCGGGFDYRIRKCKEQLPSEICPGDNNDFRRCNTHSCVTALWGPWSEWGECTFTCGAGVSLRIRVCEEGQCKGQDKQSKPCNIEECVKAHWSDWSKWGKCSVTCDQGEKTRSRNCIAGKQWDEGCLGSVLMKEVCEGPPCQKAKWSKWSQWRPCSVTCGRGNRNRERVCLGGVIGDSGCKGSSTGRRSCSGPKCVTAKWGKWTDWKACSETCGEGNTERSRSCMGGTKGDPGCAGDDEEVKTCNVRDCPVQVAATWTEWTDWSACSSTCGFATRIRNRNCQGNKNDCPGSDQEVDICIQEDCTGPLLPASWEKWSPWSACDAVCGGGLATRVRKCQGGSVGDEGCQEAGEEYKQCNEHACEEDKEEKRKKAEWLQWSEWGTCTVACDTGTQSRSRECSKPGACDGDAEESQPCNTQKCETGAPTGEGRWSDWDDWGDCPVPCGSGISRRTRTCVGGTVGIGGCQGRRTQHKRCKKDDCYWSAWESYGECSVTCGKGTRKRSRKCADGAMEATKCLGSPVYVAECEEAECPFDPYISCPEIPKPSNSEMLGTSDPPYNIGEELTFVCDVGYTARGESKIICQRDGRWSGPAPFCAAESCTRDLLRVEAGKSCHDACESDEDCSGTSNKCLCDGWCGKSCFDPDADCEPLPLPENGYIIGQVRTYGYTVTYGCDDDHILVGAGTRTCRSDGRWTGLGPKCHPFDTPGIAGDEGNIFSGKSLQRVIKGNDAKVGAWPWQALIMANENRIVSETIKAMLAGGTVINKNWILTAAHVFQNRGQSSWEELIVIALGVTLIPKSDRPFPSYVQLYQPQTVVTHEKFDLKTFDYDVALIKIGKRLKVDGAKFATDNAATHGEIVFDNFVRPIALPCISACDVVGKDRVEYGIHVKEFKQDECNKYGRSLKSVTKDLVVVTGYGDTTKNTLVTQEVEVPDSLQQAPLRLLKSDRCIDGVKRIKEEYKSARFTSRMVCTGSGEGRDACQGDSGGPLIKKVTSKTGDSCWVQVGIISWGWGCANADKQDIPYPGYYADTSNLMGWIVKQMKNNP